MSDTVNSITRFLKRCVVAGSDRAPGIRPAPLLMPLEPRIVYDASIAALAVAAHHQLSGAGRPAEHVGAPERVGQSLAGRISPPPAEHGSPVPHRGGETRSIARESPGIRQGSLPLHDTSNAQQQVVFIDPSVTAYQELITGLPAGTHYVLLNPNTDGLEQIAQYLQQHPGIDAIHLISHGAEGQIQVGSTWLNEGDLSAHSSELAEIGAAMRPGGDFLIYGCDVAEHSDGQGLVRQIAALTHLNVAASTDPTGAAALGGDWVLEYDAGTVHTPVIFSAAAERQYAELLGVTNETFDSQLGYVTPGGASGVTSFTLDSFTYTLDQPSEFAVDSTTVNQGGTPPLSTGPTDGVLFGNVQGTQLTWMTMSLSNGDKMAVHSFDIDTFGGAVSIEGLNASGTVVASTTANGSTTHVDLSTNSAFSGIKTLKIVETDGFFLSPTLNNFSYVDLSSPPAMTASGGTTSFVEGDNVASTPVAVDSGVTLTDGDTTTAKQGTVSITSNFVSGQDVLAFSNTSSAQFGDISSTYSSTTGVMTLTSASGTATIAQWQNAFRAVTYTDSATTPNTATRTVSFTLTSDTYFSSSNTVTKNVSVTGTDQTPIVHTTGGTTSYVGGTSATTIDGSISVSDSDNTTQTSGTVSITSGFHSGDTLAFTNTSSTSFGNISASYNSATGVLVLTSAGATATDAQWAHALSSVTFSSTSTTYGNRTVSFSTSDGTNTSAAATDTVNVLNPAPVVTTDSGSASFVAGDNSASTPVAVDAGLTVTDPAGSALASATVAISGNFHSGEDVLAFTNNGSTMGNIAGSYNAATGALTLTSSGAAATLAQWQAALDAVTYTDTAVTPNNATRTVSFSAVDVNSNTSSTATRTVTVTDTDQTPIVTTTGGTTTYVGGTSATTIDGGVSVSDLDNTTQSSGTVSISSGFHSGDTLAFTNSSSAQFGNTVGSYNAATGVLTLTSSGATATDAQWANALSSVAFSSTSTTYGNRTIAFATSDGTKTSAAATDTVAVLAPPKITTDSGSASFVAGDNTASTPVTIDSGLTVTDGSSTTLASATVAITGGFRSGEDVLAFTNDGSTMGNIAGAYNAATGVLTLSSSGAAATLAQWQSALDAVSYTDTAVTPNNATRTISFTAVDGGGTTTSTATRTVTVTDTDQTPIVTTTGGATNYVGGTSATTIDSGISVSDLDNTTQPSGTVSIGSGFHSGDTLAFTNTSSAQFGNIVGSYNAATGVLTLTSPGALATDAQWANALSSVAFSSTSTTYGNRTIAFATSDGTKTSAAATDTVAVLAPPKITTDSGSASFVSGDNAASTPVTIDSGLTVTDGSSTTLASATVAITGGFRSGEDVLAFINDGSTMGNIAGSYNAATGMLTMTSSGAAATLAQWQAALDAVTYTDTAVTPNNATRTVSFTAVDGGGTTSSTATRTVTVTDTDQTPIVTTTGGTTNYVGGTSATTIDAGISVSDLDNTTQSVGTVSISSGFHSGDTLAFTNTSSAQFGNIVGSYNAATGVLTLTSSGALATDAQWANALSSVAFSSTSTTYGNRTIAFATSDGTKTSAAATDTVSVLGPPQVTADSGSASFVAGDNIASTPVTIDSGLTVTDGASSTLASATVAITGGFHGGEDVLAFTNTSSTAFGNIAGSYNAATGVLTLSSSGASASLAQWQAALDAVTYTDTAVTPNNATRTASFTVLDGGGTTSNTATRTVTITDTDQTPIVTTTGGTTNYVGGTSATTIDGGISVTDRDNTTQSSGTVSITSGFNSGDTLSFVNTSSALFGNVVGSYNAATGVLTLTSAGGIATNAQWANVLSAVTFFSSTSTSYGSRTVSFVTSDGTKSSTAGTDTVSVLGPPQITADSGSASFVAGDNIASTPVIIDSGLTVTDGASSTLASATVAVTGNFRSGEDVLAFTNTSSAAFGNIAGSYNAATGVLTLSSSGATASLAQWQAALDAVTYTDTAVTPNNATRTVSFTVLDGGGTTSNTATRTVIVADTDQTPIVTPDSGSASFIAGDNTPSAPVSVDSGIGITKGDSAPLSSATVAITGNFQSGEDVLAFANTSSTTFGNIAGSYNATTGVLTLVSSGNAATLAQWQAALRAVTYTDSAVTPNSATRTVSFSVGDGITTSVTATRTVTVTDADQTPIVTADSGSASFIAGDNTASTPVTVDGGMAITKGDSTPLSSATVAITGNFHGGEDVLAFANTSGATFGNISGSYDSSTGVLTLISSGNSATLAQWQAALRAVTYTDTAVTPNSATRTVSFSVSDGITTSTAAARTVTVADTDQTPIVTSDSGSASFVAGDNALSTPVAVDSGVGIAKGDSTPLSSATLAITANFQSGEDVLAFANTSSTTFGNIAGSYNATTGVLTLVSSGNAATLAQWQAALRAVTYTDSAVTPNSATRTVSFSVGDGITTSATATRTVTVTDADQTPIVTADSGSASFIAGDNTASTPVTVDGGMAITKGDSTPLSSATVAITGNFHSGEDVLAFTNTSGTTFGNISGSYDSGTGVLTLTSSGNSATLAQWQAALRAVTYTDTAVTPNSATRTVSFSVSDGITTSTAATRTVTVADTDQTPVVAADSGSASFVAGNNAPSIPVMVDSGITVTKGDNAPLSSATVAITGNFRSGEDVLAFTNTSSTTFGNISGSFDASTGVLTLTSHGDAATLAQWQAALRTVTYTDTAVTPNNATRTISFTVVDGAGTTANTATRTVMVTDTDQTPIVATTAGKTNYVATTAATTIDSGVTVSDRDNVAQASGTVSISSGFQASDALGFANSSSAKYGNIVGSYDASAGVLTLMSAGATATDGQWQNALSAVTFSAGSNVTPGPLTVSFVVNDGSQSSAAATRSVELLAPPSPPLLFGRPAVAPQASGAPAAFAIDTGPASLFVMAELDPQSVSGLSVETAIYSGAALDGGLLGISSDGSRTESGIDVPSWLLPIRSWSAITTKSLQDSFTHDGAHRPAHQEVAVKAGNRLGSGPSLPGSKPAPPVSKPSLAEQFARHRRALHVSRHQPLLRADRSA